MKLFFNSMDLCYSVFHKSKNSVIFVAFLGPCIGYWLFGDASYYTGRVMSVLHPFFFFLLDAFFSLSNSGLNQLGCVGLGSCPNLCLLCSI